MKNIPIPDAWHKDFMKLKKIVEIENNVKISNTTLLCFLLQELVNWEHVEEEYREITNKQ